MSGWMQRIYENCKEHMQNTYADWEKVLTFFDRIWTPERDADIQECILALEKYLKGE